MNQWPFVMAAYTVALGGTLSLMVVTFVTMRQAECAAEALRRR